MDGTWLLLSLTLALRFRGAVARINRSHLPTYEPFLLIWATGSQSFMVANQKCYGR